MPQLDELSYSRAATIAAVRDYYRFLVNMYLDESCIIEPPEGGWPAITSAAAAGLEKSDEVTALLKQLPYIRSDGEQNDKAHSAPGCFFADWQAQIKALSQGGTDRNELRLITEGADFYEDAPPHTVGLTAGADNSIFVLDTELGIIHWADCPGEVRDNPSREAVEDDPYDYAPDNEADWRSDAPAWAITDFFELLKDQFRDLKFIPISPRTVTSVYVQRDNSSEGLTTMLQSIYQEHGWPDLQRYRKRECLDAVQSALEEHYPEEADISRNK